MKSPIRFLLYAVVIFALLLSGCKAAEVDAPDAPDAPAEEAAAPEAEEAEEAEAVEPVPVTILSMGADWLMGSLWDSTTGDETAMLTEFEETYGIDVIFESYPEDSARQKTMLDLSSHTGQYDIITTGVWAMATYASAGYLEPLDGWMESDAAPEFFSMDDYLPASLEGASYGGSVYSLPLYTFGPALVYNKALFEEYDVKVPETIEELEEAAAKLTLDTDGDGITDVYGITMRARRGEEPTIDSTGMSWAFGGNWFEGNANTVESIIETGARSTVNSPEFIAGYEEYAKLLQNWGPPESANWGWEECMGALAQGKAAMHLAASSAYWFTRQTATIDSEDIGIAASPMGPGGHRMMNFFDMALSINKDSKNKDEAWLVLQFITSMQVQLAQAEGGITAIPRISLVLSEPLQAIYPMEDLQTVLDTLGDAEPEYMPKIPEYVELADILGTAASEVVAGTKTAEEALNEAQLLIDQIMEDAGYYD